MLRQKGVVGRFVEFYGPGLDNLPLADRATIANMAPEYGATCGFFPIDERTIDYLRLTGRDDAADRAGSRLCAGAGPVARRRRARAAVHRHARARHGHDRAVARRPQAAAGPGAAERGRRPVQRRARGHLQEGATTRASPVEGENFDFGNGDVAIAAITSCTNTSNPSVLIAAGLVARKAREKGLTSQAVGQDQPRAGKPGGHRLSQRERAERGPQRARLRPRRLRLHDLHRQFGPAARADQQGDQRQRPGRGQRPFRQPQFRRPRVARLPRQLSRLAAAGGRLCAEGHGPLRHGQRADRHRVATASRCSSRTSGRPTRKSAR